MTPHSLEEESYKREQVAVIKLYSQSATYSQMPNCVVLGGGFGGGGYCIFIVAQAEKVTNCSHFALTAVTRTICKTD